MTTSVTYNAQIRNGINALVKDVGAQSAKSGFHESWPKDSDRIGKPAFARLEQLAIVEKLGLIHEEISEALGEIRSGHDATEVYYSHKKKGFTPSGAVQETVTFYDEQEFEPEDDALTPGMDGYRSIPVLKPEGFGVELADAIIRIADLAFLTGVDLGAAINEKMQYNATRPSKHGRLF